MNEFLMHGQEPQYYVRKMLIEYHKLSDIMNLRERIKEGIEIAESQI